MITDQLTDKIVIDHLEMTSNCWYKEVDKYETRVIDYTIIDNYAYLLFYTKEELCNYFTIHEAYVIADMLNGTLHNNRINPKSCLVSNLIDTKHFSGLKQHENVDFTILVEKLNKLTAFQAFATITMAYDFWNSEDRDIRESFYITDKNEEETKLDI